MESPGKDKKRHSRKRLADTKMTGRVIIKAIGANPERIAGTPEVHFFKR